MEFFLQLNKQYSWFDRSRRVFPNRYQIPFDSELHEKLKIQMEPSLSKFVPYPTAGNEKALEAEGFDESHKFPSVFKEGLMKNRSYTSIALTAKTHTRVYKVDINFDKWGGRNVPERPPKSHRQYIFEGCSYTYGEGVEDGETMPAYFQKLRPDVQVFNMGFPGGSAASVLYGLEQDFENQYAGLPVENADFIYTFIYDHVKRAVCPISCLAPEDFWRWVGPNYELQPDGDVVYKGKLEDRPINSLYSALEKIEIGRFLGIDFPMPESELALDHFVAIVKKLKRVASEKLKIRNFYFVFHSFGESYGSPRLEEKLRAAGIDYIDLRETYSYSLLNKRGLIPVDRHPSALTNEFTARALNEKLPP